MPKLKNLSGNDLIRIFSIFGFFVKSQKGSHIKLARKTLFGEDILTIPNYNEIDKGTLKAIIRQSSKFIDENQIYSNFYTE